MANRKISRRSFIATAAMAGSSIGVHWSGLNALASPINKNKCKLFWFLPDGMRADPEVFNVFEWASKGWLPNIKKLMDNGVYGFSIPTFPSHTPVNFATLFTGASPKTHGVADGPMHIEGRPLNKVSVGGFSSVAKKVPPIWVSLEEQGRQVTLLSIPGSTPPELETGYTIKGRWGGWGADFHAVNFQTADQISDPTIMGGASRLFFFGPQLSKNVRTRPASGWTNPPQSRTPAQETVLNAWGRDIHAYIYAGDGGTWDRVSFSLDKKKIFADLTSGQWSDWQPIDLRWKGEKVTTSVRIKLVEIADNNGAPSIRLRCLYGSLNPLIAKPGRIAPEIVAQAGPMVDFVDNFPPQLIYHDKDKDTFLEEMAMSFEWHQHASQFILDQYHPEIFIHDIYSPNQMLTSRWWMGYIDPKGDRYKEITSEEREVLWQEVLDMYKELDKIIGIYMERADENTIIALSSDHGAVPLNRWVHLNNLFVKRGWLKYTKNPETGELKIDWPNTKVVYLKMDNIYIHPQGLGGNWKRGSGAEYEKLREEVIRALYALKDDNGTAPLVYAVRHEDVANFFDLPPDRVGDLVVANEAGYGWNESLSDNLKVFSQPLKSGYKQAILPNETKAMWTPFIIAGPGVKKNYRLKRPIKMMDQYPTIAGLIGLKIPSFVEGRQLDEIYAPVD